MRIAFTGKAGVGKTAAAYYLCSRYTFTKLSIADKLKDIGKDLWPEFFMDEFKPRKLLQGLSILRQIDDAVWINYVVRQLKPNLDYTVDDCRFINEADILKRCGFVLVRIDGPSRCTIPLTAEEKNHESEREQDGIKQDITISNIDDYSDFYKRLDSLITFMSEHLNKSRP